MNLLYSALLSIGLALPSHESGQSVPTCFPVDSAADMVAWIRSVATHTAATQQRTFMHLPLVAESDVAYVTDERICRSVLGEYNKYSGTRDSATGAESPPSRRVCVIRVGMVYAVTDPTRTYGEFLIWVTTDSTFRMLAHALG
jgi:hypothetical protein